jgi:hypothetical protein
MSTQKTLFDVGKVFHIRKPRRPGSAPGTGIGGRRPKSSPKGDLTRESFTRDLGC